MKKQITNIVVTTLVTFLMSISAFAQFGHNTEKLPSQTYSAPKDKVEKNIKAQKAAMDENDKVIKWTTIGVGRRTTSNASIWNGFYRIDGTDQEWANYTEIHPGAQVTLTSYSEVVAGVTSRFNVKVDQCTAGRVTVGYKFQGSTLTLPVATFSYTCHWNSTRNEYWPKLVLTGLATYGVDTEGNNITAEVGAIGWKDSEGVERPWKRFEGEFFFPSQMEHDIDSYQSMDMWFSNPAPGQMGQFVFEIATDGQATVRAVNGTSTVQSKPGQN